MHCHTRYGSIDAKVRISEYVKMLSAKGYDGMLVTDHDSYRGYNRWKAENPDIKFRVIRGVEYDTRDAGHFIVIARWRSPKGTNDAWNEGRKAG